MSSVKPHGIIMCTGLFILSFEHLLLTSNSNKTEKCSRINMLNLDWFLKLSGLNYLMVSDKLNKVKMSGEVATLKRKIEVWREIIILADSVLSWDKVGCTDVPYIV